MKKQLFILSIGTILLGACGSSETKKEETTPAEQPAEQPAEKAVVEVSIEAGDDMKYTTNRIEVPSGSHVKLTLKNVGKMPKESMGHNWTLLGQAADLVVYATASMKAVDNDYQAPELYSDPIIFTKMLGPGESQTIEFDAPAAGTYKYVCTFPGHYASMQGELVVQ